MAMRRSASILALAVAILTPDAQAGKHGFADKPGGGKNDPVIQVFGSIGPNQGQLVSMTPEGANALYSFATGPSTFQLTQTAPVIPDAHGGANQFLQIKFPFKVSSSKVRKTLMKGKAKFADTSFLTENITITDEAGLHIDGIATIKGKDAFGTKRKGDPFFPVWLNNNNKNKLLDSKSLVYIADDGDNDLSTVEAFGGTGGADTLTKEIRVRIHEVDGVIINGFWVVKIGNGGVPVAGQPAVLLDSVSAKSPVDPAKMNNGLEVVETFSKYIVRYSEPVVPWSVGFSAGSVNNFNSTNPDIPMIYNGNSGVVPNPNPVQLQFPFFGNFTVNASPNGVSSYFVPFDVRPVNPNNLSEYQVNPLLDMPGKVMVTLTTLAGSLNANLTPSLVGVSSAVTSLYNVQFDDTVDNFQSFFSDKGNAFVNVPVSPGVVYYTPVSGSGVGAINLDGRGFETNDPATERLLLLTSNEVMCTCTVLTGLLAGSHLLGCNGNTFGDPTFPPVSPIGIAGNPPGTHLGPSTPIPGVNEGSDGTTANLDNPFGVFPPGFETVCRDSNGDARLTQSPVVGSVSDMVVGDFLDLIFFDTLNPAAQQPGHGSVLLGNPLDRNSISDPPMPNPPPLRLAVGLPPVDVVFNQQKLLKPAFVIQGDEVWQPLEQCGTSMAPAAFPKARILLQPNQFNPLLGDVFPPYAQNGPIWQTFGALGSAYAARQQIGNFLYVADRDQGAVTVLNSNTFEVLQRITIPDPEGLGIGSDLRDLYVSNFGADSLSIIDIDPFSGSFHKEVNRVNVGSGPRSVAVQPDNEDILVANYIGNSISIIEAKTQTVRNTITGPFSNPWDIAVTPRQILSGFTNLIYFAYVASQGTGDVVVYESGPDGSTGFGADDIRWAVTQADRYEDMRGLLVDHGNFPGAISNLASGVYITHRDAETGLAMITRVAFTSQLPFAGPLPPVALPGSILNSPGTVQRAFEEVAFWGGPMVPFNQQLNPGGQDQVPYDLAAADMTCANFHQAIATKPGGKTNFGAFPGLPTVTIGTFTTNAGSINSKHPHRQDQFGGVFPTFFADRMYASFPGDDRIQVLDANAGGKILNTIQGAPRAGRLVTYFDQ